MLPNGPAWTSAGVASRVCSRFGWKASCSSTAMDPAALRSSAETGSPSYVAPTTIRPRRRRRSAKDVASERITITSDAAVMSKPVWRGTPSWWSPRPTTTVRSARSLTSRTRRHVIERASRPRALPWCRWLSIIAASRLWAAVTAWKSPVRCRFSLSIGSSWAYPAPAAPPLIPNVGPMDGWRRVRAAERPVAAMPWARPTAVAVFPSPSGVGVSDVTTTYRTPRACLRAAASSGVDTSSGRGSTFATKRP